jgi:outer membrane protein OmpA-like peptidoglycan-associated protein
MKRDAKGEADSRPAPRFLPMLATTGTIGLFTAETADTLPKGAFAFTAYGNKFGRTPGSVTIFQMGLDLSYGLTDRINVYGSFQPYGHAHIGNGSQLSLSPLNAFNPLYPNTIFPTILATGTPGYVEDFPFAANDGGGIGNITLGVKFGFLSERLGNPFSLSVRNDFIIAGHTNLPKLLVNGTLGSPYSDLISAAVSKQWSNVLTTTLNVGYLFTTNPSDFLGPQSFDMADQFRTSAGFLLFPDKRFQPMSEYSAVIFHGGTPNTTFGPRDPVDGVWGLRIYPWKDIAVDVGYRYMLNLPDLNDRHGFVIKLGTAYWPEKAPPVNHPPTVSVSADKNMVYLDSGDVVPVQATASDPDNDPLTYTWSSTCGRIDGDGPQVRWLSAGTSTGTCTITAKVDDAHGGAASAGTGIAVEPEPNHPPTISCSADHPSVFAGERVHITTTASDPDGDPLTYTWRANGGQVVGSGAAVDFDTTGLAPGAYSVTVRVEDGRGGAADCSSTVDVKAVPPPPQASKISECAFGRPLSTRIDNVCKRILDDVALRLQNEPRASAVIIGYSDPKERRPDQIAADRAANAVKYLGEKSIDSSRVTTRTGAGQAGATNNRRIDVIFVPEGAAY